MKPTAKYFWMKYFCLTLKRRAMPEAMMFELEKKLVRDNINTSDLTLKIILWLLKESESLTKQVFIKPQDESEALCAVKEEIQKLEIPLVDAARDMNGKIRIRLNLDCFSFDLYFFLIDLEPPVKVIDLNLPAIEAIDLQPYRE